MKGRNVLSWVTIQLGLITLGFLALELLLRVWGYAPGDVRPNWLNFKTVDSLYIIPDFYTNKEGLIVADSLVWTRQNVYINTNGFRTKSFTQLDSSRRKLMFIGDSFTWGMSAKPLQDSCFTDLLRSETDFEIINLGIPTADPVQYFELTKRYVPELHPDCVFVVFFTGNDIMKQDRKIVPNEPYYYFTNAGAILADIDGKHFKTLQSAYNYFMNDKYYLNRPRNFPESIISRSSLLSRIYSVRFRIQEKLEFENAVRNSDITKRYLNRIQKVCAENKVPVKFLLIPEVKEADKPFDKFRKKYGDLLDDESLKSAWLVPENTAENFTDYPDAHLNNKGHRAYADYLKHYLVVYYSTK